MANLTDELKALIDVQITYKRIAGNSIILYWYGKPGDENTKTLWIEPPWRYEQKSKYVLGSNDLPSEADEEEREEDYQERCNLLCALSDPIVGTRVTSIEINPITNDIALDFGNEHKLMTFACADNQDIWLFTDKSRSLKIVGATHGVEQIKPSEHE